LKKSSRDSRFLARASDPAYELPVNEPSIRFRFRAAIFSVLIALGLLAVSPATEESKAKFQGVPVLPGKTISATVPLSPEEKTYAAIGGNRVPVNAVATLAVPPGFDPQKSWPVLVVFSTSDFQRENRGDVPFNSVKERGSNGALRSQPSTLNCSALLGSRPPKRTARRSRCAPQSPRFSTSHKGNLKIPSMR
jgi:hypothetical protein